MQMPKSIQNHCATYDDQTPLFTVDFIGVLQCLSVKGQLR